MKTPLISQEAYEAALACGKLALEKPHATAARFNRRTHVLSIDYSNGMTVSFDARKSELLAAHPGADLSEPEVSPGGDGITFPHAGLAIATHALVAGFLPEDAARQKIASLMGKVRSVRKSEASRVNGAKGGRPRKALATA